MLGRFRAHIRHNVVGYLALFVALGGTSYAVATIGSRQVVNDSLKSVDLNNVDGVRSADVRDDDLINGGLVGSDIIESTLGKVGDADTVDGLDSSQLQGQQGLPGEDGQSFTWRGNWSPEIAYLEGDAVGFQGSSYVAAQDGPQSPEEKDSGWDLMASQGEQGPGGAQGPKGLSWRGAWDPSTNYIKDDAVQRGGSSYVATNTIPLNSVEPPGGPWQLLASRGGPGATNVTVRIGTPQSIAPDTIGNAFVLCASNEVALSGGSTFPAGGVRLIGAGGDGSWANGEILKSVPGRETQPALSGQAPNSWYVEALNESDQARNLTVHAVCASP